MPKGDPKRVQNAIDYQGGMAQGDLGGLRQTQQDQYGQMINNYQNAVQQGNADYSGLQGNYQDFMGNTNNQYNQFDNGAAIQGWQGMADNGGFSGRDIQDIRARAIAPTRSIYANAQDELQRNKALQGGYSPNAAAASAQMARQMSNTIGDQNINANASIAQMRQQGRLAGLSGLSQSQLASMQGRAGSQLGAMSGASGLYGTAPGMANMYGNQVLGTGQQLLGSQGLQNQLGLGIMENQLGRGQMPNRFDAYKSFGQGTGAMLQGIGGIAAASHSSLKDNISPADTRDVTNKLKKLRIHNWNYKGDSTRHIGPMAEDFKGIFGVGDGKSIHLADVMGITLAAAKERANATTK